MHNYIKTNKVEKHFLGGLLKGLFSKQGAAAVAQGVSSKLPKSGTGSMSTGIPGTDTGEEGTEASNLSNILGQGLNTALSGITAFSDINNSGLNKNQKTMARADSAVDAISGAASMIPGIGGVIGGALGTLNKIGGSLIGNPKEVKNYVANDAVMSSSAFTGVANQASEAGRSAESYKGSGLAGKLFGKGKVKKQLNSANSMQNDASKLISDGQFVKNRAASSTDVFSTKNMANLYDTDRWTTNNIAMGQQGMKLGKLRNPKTNPTSQEKYVQNAQGKIEVDAFDEALSAPQKASVWMLGGGYKAPSEALGVENKYAKAGLDMVADPLNALFLLKGVKAAKTLQTAKQPQWAQGSSRLINLKHPRQAEQVSKSIRNVKLGSNTQDAQSLYGNLTMNKEGGVIDFKKILKAVKKPEPIEILEEVTEEVESFKEGGTINVIVDGKLHAHKNSLKELDEFKDAEITEKGIAVISKSEGGEIKQHAEVEKDELILHLKLSKQLESWAEKGSTAHMIKAGKLLAKEILDNTKDSKSGILEDD